MNIQEMGLTLFSWNSLLSVYDKLGTCKTIWKVNNEERTTKAFSVMAESEPSAILAFKLCAQGLYEENKLVFPFMWLIAP